MATFNPVIERKKAQAELFWEQTSQSSRLASLVAVVSCAVLWPFVEPVPLLLWGLMTLTLSQARILALHHWLKNHSIDQMPERFLKLASYSMVFPGIAWMSLVFLYIPANDPNVFLIVLFLVAGMVSNSLPALSSSVSAYISFISPPAIALVSMSLMNDNWKLAIILVLSVGGLIAMARKNNSFINKAITLDLENCSLLTDMTAAKKKVELANESKTRFLAGISHDLRQPLQALTIYLDLLIPFQRQSKPKYLIDQANRAQNELTDAFNTLLELGRFETANIEVNRQVVDLQQLCKELAQSYRIIVEQKALKFHLELVPAICDTDRFLVSRILNNLISNAIKFTEKGEISLITQIIDGRLLVKVQDTGPGIAPGDQQAIFQEYYQVNPNQRRSGVGLGLNLSQSLCRAMDIKLNLDSTLGKGSQLFFSLPLCPDQSAIDKNALIYDSSNPYSQENYQHSDAVEPGLLTFIEDNVIVSDAVKRLFIDWGWTVDHFECFEHWSDSTKTTRPDLLISDYDLPNGKSGLASVKSIRQHWRDETLPSIILTGRSDPESLKKIKLAKIFPLTKPVKLPQLQIAIRHLKT